MPAWSIRHEEQDRPNAAQVRSAFEARGIDTRSKVQWCAERRFGIGSRRYPEVPIARATLSSGREDDPAIIRGKGRHRVGRGPVDRGADVFDGVEALVDAWAYGPHISMSPSPPGLAEAK